MGWMSLLVLFSAPEKRTEFAGHGPANKKVLFLVKLEGTTGKSATLKAPPGSGARAGDRYNNPHRCNGQPEAEASEPWAKCP